MWPLVSQVCSQDCPSLPRPRCSDMQDRSGTSRGVAKIRNHYTSERLHVEIQISSPALNRHFVQEGYLLITVKSSNCMSRSDYCMSFGRPWRVPLMRQSGKLHQNHCIDDHTGTGNTQCLNPTMAPNETIQLVACFKCKDRYNITLSFPIATGSLTTGRGGRSHNTS